MVLTIFAVCFIIGIIYPGRKGNDPIFYLAGILVITLFSFGYLFYSLYISKVIEGNIPDLKSILVRSIKFSIAISLFFAAFLFLLDLGDKQKISPLMAALAVPLLAIFFLVICNKFDLSLTKRKKSKEENRISELHDELNDFYQEALKKTKRNI